jgi:hypothetical protein
MATYNTAFGSLPGYNEMLGTTNTTGGGQQQVYGQRAQQQRQQQQQPAPAQTFAQMQQRGMARPAPPSAPQAQPFAQYGGSQQAQQMRQRLQSQLEQFGQAPSRFDTQAFQQIRGAQAANLQQEYRGQLQALNEEMARRGLSASSVGGGRMGDLAGQQARALASLDAELLQRAAETQAQDRAQLLQAGQGLAELAGSQDLAQFEANRVAQAATFENQLRAAQFGQQQFEQAGQEAFQGAQAEEAAQQAARAFDLQATGQAAGLSMDLQRLLGQQEIERAQLTGQLGGAQTLAAQQQAEQRRQFDIQQMLQAQLGLGGLSLEQQRFAEQARQFGQTLAEQQAGRLQQAGLSQQEITLRAQQLQQEAATQGRQLSLEEARLQVQQQQFGAQLGETQAARLQQYGVTQQELGLRSQQLQQEAQLQGRQLSIQEAQNQAGNQIERERMAQQGQQFGLQLGETQAARLQQYGLSVQELGLRSQQLQQEAALQGRQMSIAEAQNLAQNGLEQQKITQQASQFGLTLNEQQAQRLQQGGFTAQELALEAQKVGNQAAQFGQTLSAQERQNAALNNLEQQKITDDRSFRAQQLGLNGRELDLRATQIQQEFAQRGQQITNDQAYRQAELALLTTQIQNENAIAGQQISVDQARIQAQRDISAADNTAQMSRLNAQLSSQEKVATLETQLRRQLGMMEATGQVYQPGEGATVTQAGGLTQAALQNAYARAAQLSQITGQQYTVDPKDGKIVAATGEAGRTFAAQLQAAGITGTFDGGLTQEALQNAYQRAAQLSQITGVQYDVDPKSGAITPKAGATAGTQAETLAAQLQKAGLTGTLGGQSTLERLQQNLQNAQIMSQITGKQYTVNEKGELVTTSTADTEARRQFDLEQRLRGSLGLSEAAGFVYNPFTGQLERTSTGAPMETVQGQLARSNILMQLAQSLGSLDPDKLAELLKRQTESPGTPPPSGDTGTPNSGSAAGSPPSGGSTFPVGNNFTDKFGYTWTKTTTGWVLKSGPSNTPPADDELSKAPTGASEGAEWTSPTGKKYVFTGGKWVLKTDTPPPSGEFYKTAASGATVSAAALSVLSTVTSPNPTGIYFTDGKYWQNAGAGWYEVILDPATSKWVRK